MIDHLSSPESADVSHLCEPQLNRLYAMALAHYGVVDDPARVRDPNGKGTN